MRLWIEDLNFLIIIVCVKSVLSFPTVVNREYDQGDSHNVKKSRRVNYTLFQEVSNSNQNSQPNFSSNVLVKNQGISKIHAKSNFDIPAGYINHAAKFDAAKFNNKEHHHSIRTVSLARREALDQTDVDLSGKSRGSTMVLSIASTLAALFSMSVLVAIFQCCCRKRNRSVERQGTTEAKHEGDVKTAEKSEKPAENTDQTSDEKKEKPREISKDGEEQVSFKDKLKAFEKKDVEKEPSPKPGPTPKKRPQSEAFKALQAKNLPIMGMPMGIGPRPPKQKEKTEDDEETEVILRHPEICVTSAEESSYKQPENPDVVIADEDEDDPHEFGHVKRETEVLRSYRKAPPPKNRNRSSAAFRRKNAQQSMTNLMNEEKEVEPLLKNEEKSAGSQNGVEMNKDMTNKTEKSDTGNSSKKSRSKSPDSSEGKTEKSRSKTPEKTGTKTPDKSGSKTPEKTGSKTPEKTGSKTPEKSGSKTPEKSEAKTSKDKPSAKMSEKNSTDDKSEPRNGESKPLSGNTAPPSGDTVPPSGNIFLQIDPTVKQRSPKLSPISSPASQDFASRADKVKSSPSFLKDDKLMEALNEKLKSQQEGKSSKDKYHHRRSLNTDL